MPLRSIIIMQIKNYKYYSNYTDDMSTIQLSPQTKKLISTFGSKEDTYEQIILRLYDLAVKEQLRQVLFSTEDAMTLDEARKFVLEE
jgi:hypothetical protein